jgi:hypothetical protein
LDDLQVANEKLKENEKYIETLRMECSRWQDENKSLELKLETSEAQLNQKQLIFNEKLKEKDNEINEIKLRHQPHQSTLQKSALMEEFEEIDISSNDSNENNDSNTNANNYIHLKKKIKMLSEDNSHLISDNKQLNMKIKQLTATTASSSLQQQQQQHRPTSDIDQLELEINELKAEIFSLKNELEEEKDKHRLEILNIQDNYKEKTNFQLVEKQNEIESLKRQLNDAATENETIINNSPPDSKSDEDGWCLNGDDLKLKLESDDSNEKLKKQIEMLESSLKEANEHIFRLKNLKSPEVFIVQQENETNNQDNKSIQQSSDYNYQKELNEQLKEELDFKIKQLDLNDETYRRNLAELRKEIDSLSSLKQEIEHLNETIDTFRKENEILKEETEQLKTDNPQREKEDENTIIINNLNNTIVQLQFKLDEKINETKLLSDQINDLNRNINNLKEEDNKLFDELTVKTQQFVTELETTKKENDNLRNSMQQNETGLRNELEQLQQQYNQIYSYLENKNNESLQYYNEIQRLNAIASQLTLQLDEKNELNAKLNDQYENILKDFQRGQKIVEDLDEETKEWNTNIPSSLKVVDISSLTSVKLENIDIKDNDINEQMIDQSNSVEKVEELEKQLLQSKNEIEILKKKIEISQQNADENQSNLNKIIINLKLIRIKYFNH